MIEGFFAYRVLMNVQTKWRAARIISSSIIFVVVISAARMRNLLHKDHGPWIRCADTE